MKAAFLRRLVVDAALLGHEKWPCSTAACRMEAQQAALEESVPGSAREFTAHPQEMRSTSARFWPICSRAHADPRCAQPGKVPRENETLDPVVATSRAVNRFYFDNLDDDGCFFSRRRNCEQNSRTPRRPACEQVVQQCGSGVTACHNLLAMNWPACRLEAVSRFMERVVRRSSRPVARG